MMAALSLAFWLLVFLLAFLLFLLVGAVVLFWVELLPADLPTPDEIRDHERTQRNQTVIEAYQRGEFTPQQWAELLTLNAGLRAQWERRNGY